MSNFLSDPAAPKGPTATRGETQIDGTVSAMGERPTRAPLQDRSASPAAHNTSGMECAMAELADRTHPRRR